MKKENLALALLDELPEDDALLIEEMLENDNEVSEICDYINQNVSTEVKSEILDRLASRFPEVEDLIDQNPKYLEIEQYPPSVKREMEFIEYLDSLNPEDQEYVKQFYYEYYNKGSANIPEDQRLLSTKKMISEAHRTANSLYRDAFNYTKNRDMLAYLEDESNELNYERPGDWQAVFVARGYEAALETIVNEALAELENKQLQTKNSLIRFYIRMDRLRRLNNRDVRTRREMKRG